MIKKHFKFYLLFLCIFCINQGYAHFGAKYEPPDGRIIHGLGQYVTIFYTDLENWQYVTEYQNAINIPVIYSVYAYINPLIAALDSTDFIDIVSNHGFPYILVVGIVLIDDSLITGNINIPVQSILNGNWDQQIINIANRIKGVNAPVYVRPGFEFGHGNGGFHNNPDMKAGDFENIGMHIYNIFQQQNVTNVAWIWNTVNPNDFNYIEWYPGDSYVDWWGINYFTSSQINNGDGFLADAAAHNKPVMICESCPIQNGGTTNSSNWNTWFVPYFNKIKNTPYLKGFIYISDPWNRPGFFDDWPDSRININSIISQNYTNEMLDSIYIHMPEYQINPGIINSDSSTQAPITEFLAEAGDTQVNLSWINPVTLAGVKIIRKTRTFPQNVTDGVEIFDGIDTVYIDTNVENDTTYYYAAFAYNTIPNLSIPVYAYATPYGTNILKDKIEIPQRIKIFQNYPNPFNSSTTFRIESFINSIIMIKIFNEVGEQIGIIKRYLTKKNVEIIWNSDFHTSGIYFANITIQSKSIGQKFPNINKTLKFLLIK